MNPYAKVRELLPYFCTYAPEFPAEDETDLQQEAEKVENALIEALAITKNVDKRRWIEMAMKEFSDSIARYRDGDSAAGFKAIRNAERYFDNVTMGKTHVVNFIAGPDGRIKSTGEDEGGIRPL